MFLEKLYLLNFRNFAEEEIKLTPETTVLIGNNGQGKTNILEAIYLLGSLRSFRTSSLALLKKTDTEITRVKGDAVSDGNVKEDIEVLWNRLKKSQKYLGKNVTPSRFVGRFFAVSFTPDDMTLLTGGPENRRKLLDKAIFSIYPSYLNTIREYQKILKGRNAILQNCAFNRRDNQLLEAWDERLAQSAAEVFVKRRELTGFINVKIDVNYKNISGAARKATVKYQPSITADILEETSIDIIKEKYLAYWSSHHDADIARGRTQKGAHTDDILFFLDGENIKETASQGQRRSMTIALKISELEIIKDKKNINAVLLLDDVMSELDISRRARLMEYLSAHQGQVIASTTDLKHITIDKKTNYSILRIENGKVFKE